MSLIRFVQPLLTGPRPPSRRVRATVAQPGPAVEAIEPRLLFATFVVTTTADSGLGSLRQAITDSNANDTAAAPVDDEIVFNILPAGAHSIDLASPLPEITGNLTIDATTQPGYEPDDTPVIALNGQGAGAGADGLRIASTGPIAASNVIGLIINRFQGNGVVISGQWNSVAQCYIGTDATGAAAGPGNGGYGILITGSNNLVAENTIAFNGRDGIAVASASVGNTAAPNSIFSNTGLGIDLGADGPTPNDLGDIDDGANRRQNYPILTAVDPAAAPATGLMVHGTINTTPNTLVEVVLYSSPTADGEGRNVLEVLHPFQTDASGNATFTTTLSNASAGNWITATATSYAFSAETSETNTSEFSPAVRASAGTTPAVYVRGSAWAGADADPANTTFKEYLQAKGLGDATYGYWVDTLPADTTLPWINVNEIVLHFPAPPAASAVPTPATVTLHGQLSDYAVSAVTSLDAQTFILSLDRPLGQQPAGSADPTQGDRVTLTVANAGAGGTAFSTILNVLQGDADRNQKRVTAIDLGFVKARANTSTNDTSSTGAVYTAFADLNGSGRIDAIDLGAVKARNNDALPPAPVAGASNPSAAITSSFFPDQPIL